MRLAVNVDHFATLREARKGHEPEPLLAALLAEQAGADGIVCHIRGDRRHIKERDLKLLRQTVKTKLIVEMAATEAMKKIALDVKPDIVSLVPERENELTTEGGLNVMANKGQLAAHIQSLQKANIKVSIFVDPNADQIQHCKNLDSDVIEINTGQYAELKPGEEREKKLKDIQKTAQYGHSLGLTIHAGHGLDYKNILPVAAIPEIEEFSIGFSIVARAAIVGVDIAVREMKALIL